MKYIFALINIALLTVSAFFCADMFYKVLLKDISSIPEIEEPEAKQIDSGQKQAKKGVDGQSHEIIVQRNLFKVETKKKDGSAKDPEEAKEKLEPTTLSLTLWGTVTGGSNLYAVIEDKKSKLQALYQEGDLVQDAKVKKILKKEIILTYQGKDQILEMETDSKKTGTVKNFQNNPNSGQVIINHQDGLTPKPQAPSDNAAEILTNIRFRPFFTKGSPDGIMVYGVKPESIFNRAGLRNGDIIKTINGTPVETVEDASSLLSGLENSGDARVTLIRRGETKELSFNSEQIEKPEDETPEDQEPGKAENSEEKNKGEE